MGAVRYPRQRRCGRHREDAHGRAQSDLDEAASRIPTQRRGTPDDIAHAAIFLLSDLAANITGQTLTVDGGGSLGAVGETLPVFVTNPKIRERFAD